MMQLLILLLIGAVAGWLAGSLMRVRFRLIGMIIVGVLGAMLGGFLLPKLGVYVAGGLVSSVITATFGAIVLLVILKLIMR